MKRALDRSLPINPVSGQQPIIEPTSSFDTAPKRARPETGFPTPSFHLSTVPRSFTPVLSRPHFYAPYTNGNNLACNGHGYMSPGTAMTSPLNLGGPLSTPVQAGHQGHGNIQPSQSPFMMVSSMMSPVGVGYGGMPYMPVPSTPIMSPSMNPHTMTGNYGPAAAAAAAAAAGNMTGRTVYVGGLPPEASVDELLSIVRFGPIENVRILPDKNCVFISFLDGSTAAAFHADANVKQLTLKGFDLRVGWGKASHVPINVAQAVREHQATRNVFVGNLNQNTNEQDLRSVLGKFGPIDQVKIVRDKNIGFVHFLGIGTAMKVVQHLPSEPGWTDKRVNYGKDRCAYVPKAQQAAVQAAQAQAASAIAAQHAQLPGSPYAFSPMTPSFAAFGTPQSGFGSPMFTPGGFGEALVGQAGNRNVYLGNVHPDTATEELCNNIKGGVLQQIRILKEKGIAFVTFIEPSSAHAFHQHCSTAGLTVNNRRLKVGWGKHSGPINPMILQAVQSGATRNVYLGQIEDFETFNTEKLRRDFESFGEIELINFYREKQAAFVNFASIASAQKAIEGIKAKPEYGDLRVSFGKDRCANPPRGFGRSATPLSGHRSRTSRSPSEGAMATATAAEAPNGIASDGTGSDGITPKASDEKVVLAIQPTGYVDSDDGSLFDETAE